MSPIVSAARDRRLHFIADTPREEKIHKFNLLYRKRIEDNSQRDGSKTKRRNDTFEKCLKNLIISQTKLALAWLRVKKVFRCRKRCLNYHGSDSEHNFCNQISCRNIRRESRRQEIF